jgi:hypothetical protein
MANLSIVYAINIQPFILQTDPCGSSIFSGEEKARRLPDININKKPKKATKSGVNTTDFFNLQKVAQTFHNSNGIFDGHVMQRESMNLIPEGNFI